MKSMNCGTPASVALPLRSSRGMIRSTRIATVAYSCAVKNFDLNAVPAGFAPAAGAGCCARAAACSASAGVHTSTTAAEDEPRSLRAVRLESLVIVFFVVHISILFRASATYSEVRIASARIVHVQFLCELETNGPASATNRFFTSCAWQLAFNTDVC